MQPDLIPILFLIPVFLVFWIPFKKMQISLKRYEHLLTSIGIATRRIKYPFNFGLGISLQFSYKGHEVVSDYIFRIKLRYPGHWAYPEYFKDAVTGKQYCVGKEFLSRSQFGERSLNRAEPITTKEKLQDFLDELCNAADRWDRERAQGKKLKANKEIILQLTVLLFITMSIIIFVIIGFLEFMHNKSY